MAWFLRASLGRFLVGVIDAGAMCLGGAGPCHALAWSQITDSPRIVWLAARSGSNRFVQREREGGRERETHTQTHTYTHTHIHTHIHTYIHTHTEAHNSSTKSSELLRTERLLPAPLASLKRLLAAWPHDPGPSRERCFRAEVPESRLLFTNMFYRITSPRRDSRREKAARRGRRTHSTRAPDDIGQGEFIEPGFSRAPWFRWRKPRRRRNGSS